MSQPLKTDALVVTSGGASDPKIAAGTADPSLGFTAPEGSVYLRYVASAGKIYVKTGPGDVDWGQVDSGGMGGTLDQAYNSGGPGAGRTINANSGAIQVNATTSDTQAAILVNRNPGSSSAALGIDLSLSSNNSASAVGVRITDAGSGSSIGVTKTGSGAAILTDLQNVGAQALSVTVTAAPTSVSPISVVANTTGTTATLVSLSKIPGGATAGAALSVSMGANTTGAGVVVSQVGTGAAIEISSGALQIDNSSPGVSPANTGRLKYNSGTQTFQVSLNGAAYVDLATGSGFTLAIGDAISSSTVGSALFVGASNLLAQDNANFFWDNTNKRLGIGTNTPGVVPIIGAAAFWSARSAADVIEVRSTVTDGYSTIWFTDSANVHQTSFGFGNSTVPITRLRGKHYLFGPNDFVIDDMTAIAATIKPTAGSVNLEMFNGSSAAVSSANAGRLRYNTTGQKFQISTNGGAYVDMALLAAAFTTGSVPFANSSGQLTQDNAAFFWDATQKRMLITQTAADPLDGKGSITLRNTNAAGNASVYFNNAAGSFVGADGYDNTVGNIRLFTGSGIPYDIYTGTIHRMRIAAGGTLGNGLVSFGMGATDGLYSLDVRGATAASRIHFSNSTTDTGGYLISGQDSQALISGGSSYNGTNFINKATSTSILDLVLGGWLFYNGTGLTVGGVGSYTMRMQIYPAGGVEINNSDSATVSIASAGKIRYTTSGQKLQISSNTGAYFDVATYAAALTSGSVLFANGSNQLAQDNANLFWDDTNNRLGIGSNAPAKTLHVQASVNADTLVKIKNTDSGGLSSIDFYRSDDSLKVQIGYDNSLDSNYLYSSLDFQIKGTAFANKHWFGVLANAAFHQFANGSADGGSQSGTGKIIYTTTGQKFQISANAGSYFDIALLASALTTGSIPFADSSGHLAQDNTNLFWDDTNNRLGIGTATPGEALHVAGNAHITGKLTVDGAIDPTSLTLVAASNLAYFETADGQSASVSAANRGRIRYNVPNQRFQASKNAAAYEDVATLDTRQTFTKAQDSATSALTYGATIAVDASLSNTFSVTLTGATAQLLNPSNLVDGETLVFRVTQDGTGGRALTFDTNYDFGTAGAPDLTFFGANQTIVLTGTSDGTKVYIREFAAANAIRSYHEPTLTANAATNSPGSQPSLAAIGSTIVAKFTVNSDIAYRLFKIPTWFTGNAAFHVHWTKSNNANESTHNVRWQIVYTVSPGNGSDINVAGTTLNLDDTYDDNGTTTRIMYRTSDVSATGFVAGYYVAMSIQAVTPTGTALGAAPYLVSVDLTYSGYVNQ